MTDVSAPQAAPEWQTSRWQHLLNIRNKIIIPYLTITLFVAAVGTYIVTRLVAGSLQERLSNQLLESSRVASDSVVRREQEHLEVVRLISLSNNLDQAILAQDTALITLIVDSLTANANIPAAAVLDQAGQPLVQRGTFAQQRFDYSSLAAVQAVLANQRDSRGDKFAGITPAEPVFFVAAPVLDPAGTVIGAVVVGTPLSEMLAKVKQEALSDVAAYTNAGDLAAATFITTEPEREALLLTSEETQRQLTLLQQRQETDTLTIEINQRQYQGIYAPLIVRGDTVGLMAVFLPSDFIVLQGGTSARIFAVIFGLAAFGIIIIGLILAGSIVTPVNRLVITAQNVTAGDLTQRSRIKAYDEIGFLGFTFDIMADRLEVRTHDLEAEAARLSSILKTSQTGMIMVDTADNLSFMNEAAARFLQPEINVWQDLLTFENSNLLEINNFILTLQITDVFSADGERIGTLIALQDITQQELAGRLKDRFIARVSHELRTPLTAIKGYSDLVQTTLEMGKTPKPQHFAEIVQQTELLDQMIVQLLGISQMSAGTFTIRRDQIDLVAVLAETAAAKQPQIDAAQLQLEQLFELPTCSFHGDHQRLRWAFDHLLDNAVKYTLPGGVITYAIQLYDEQNVCIQVSDTGVGIRSVDQPHIFDAYYRREAITPAGDVIDPRGLGLGLYVARNVIEAHGGTLSVESVPGKGSIFSANLPLQQP